MRRSRHFSTTSHTIEYVLCKDATTGGEFEMEDASGEVEEEVCGRSTPCSRWLVNNKCARKARLRGCDVKGRSSERDCHYSMDRQFCLGEPMRSKLPI